jgi:Tfp pilus assembly protein PilN
MLQKIRTYIKEGTVYCGLEIYERNGAVRYHLLHLKKTGDELHILKEDAPKNLEGVPALVPKNTPLLLTINTSKVLAKKMESNRSGSTEGLVDTAFPNLNMENFYYEVALFSGTPVVTIAKKDYVDGIREQLRDLKLDLVHYSLGLSTLVNLLAYWEEPVMTVSNQQLDIGDGRIEAIQPFSEEIRINYNLNGLALTNYDLLAFSNIIGFLAKKKAVSNFHETNAILANEFRHKRIFSFGLRASLAVILVILLGNFFVFDHYYRNVEALKASMELDQSMKNEQMALEVSVNKKQKRVEALSTNANSKASYFLDELAGSVPTSILLDQITYRPLTKQIREAKPIELNDREILISGVSRDGDLFTQWVLALEKLDWVSNVEPTSYEQLPGSTTKFQIRINIREAAY